MLCRIGHPPANHEATSAFSPGFRRLRARRRPQAARPRGQAGPFRQARQTGEARPPKAPPPRRTADDRRAHILEAALRVFEAKGLEGANMRSIAREAGYTPGALYFYYASQEEIYADLLSHSLRRLHAATCAAGAEFENGANPPRARRRPRAGVLRLLRDAARRTEPRVLPVSRHRPAWADARTQRTPQHRTLARARRVVRPARGSGAHARRGARGVDLGVRALRGDAPARAHGAHPHVPPGRAGIVPRVRRKSVRGKYRHENDHRSRSGSRTPVETKIVLSASGRGNNSVRPRPHARSSRATVRTIVDARPAGARRPPDSLTIVFRAR